MGMALRYFCCALTLAALAVPAAAQPPRQAQQTPQPVAPGPVRGEAWYLAQLEELAEVLGGAHYLRRTCYGARDQRWRNYMRDVIDREPQHEAQMTDAFNRGYRAEESRFAACEPAARQVEAELRARGLRVARGLSARHGE
jgi:uncharacterized protein (TIGR02301 family)